jgi:serine phosphatase RsbU (regulator of sigma subunit)
MSSPVRIQVAVAKIEKYASSESGDTLEMVERPQGGLSLVLVDGQRSGKSAKAISNLVAGKAIALLAEGVRDGAAARAAHDYLYMQRGGKVSATLNIVSVDMVTKTLVLSRNSHCPAIVQTAPGAQTILDEPTTPVGIQRITRPEISEFPLQTGMAAVVFTDGLLNAGQRRGLSMDVYALVDALYTQHARIGNLAQPLADSLLAAALELDEGRPADDISVLALAVVGGESDGARRLQATLPIPPILRP